MEHFIAYHSAEKMEREYEADGSLAFWSRKNAGLLNKAVGNLVWIVQGTRRGSKTEYALCGVYVANSLSQDSDGGDGYLISGTEGQDFGPRIVLNDREWFPALLKSQSNFSLGFNRINDADAIRGLEYIRRTASESNAPPANQDADPGAGAVLTSFHDQDGFSQHAAFQAWRETNANGVFLTIATSKLANLHGAQCQHLGSTDWPADVHSLTKKRKVCATSEVELLAWTKATRLAVQPCHHCLRDGYISFSQGSSVSADNDADDDDWFSAEEYRDALVQLSDDLSPLHRRMLVAHAEAPDCMLSVRQLAAAGGYDKPSITYSQYGRVGHMLAQALGITEQWKVWTYIIGDGFRTEEGELIWEMHPALVDALVMLGWASRAAARDALDDIKWVGESDGLGTEREAIIRARIGQGPFRNDLLRYWGSCAVTGISEPSVLRASHIKPWRDSTNEERLDPNNGLLLAAHIDALFDAGLVTFEEDGKIRLSILLANEDLKQLGITSEMRLRLVSDSHERYLSHHRNSVFRSGNV